MTQTVRRSPGQRATACRPGSVYLHITCRVDRHGMPIDGVEDGYVGKSRDVERRTLQHAGRLPQRTGEVTEAPWFDLRVGDVRILETGDWTDAELDARERYWIGRLQPRYNDQSNEGRPDRIRKLEARQHRDARDVARGLLPRRWGPVYTPSRRDRWREVLASPWTWWGTAWVLLTSGSLWILDEFGQDLTLQAVGWSGLAAVVVLAWWRFTGRHAARRRWRRLWRRLWRRR